MNNPDHIFWSVETIFWVKVLKFFDADPGSRMETVRIRDPGWKKVGSGINIPDPQHCWIVPLTHLPGLRRAGSSVSCLLVAMITLTERACIQKCGKESKNLRINTLQG